MPDDHREQALADAERFDHGRNGVVQRDAGDDAGQRDRQHDERATRRCRPKKRYRWTAKATSVPRTRAIAVAPRPALTEVHSASRAPALPHARLHHSVVNPVGGQANVRSALNELISTTSSGT